jgi:ABC-type Fe3+-hydroxamate transport system substrate-binding protein
MPSMTESMFDLGLGGHLVGITDYCIHPAAGVEKLPRIGGTKNPRVKDVLALKPDLILANWEENTRSTVEALREAGVGVWVTFPQSVRESIEVLWTLANLFRSAIAKIKLQTLELTLDWAISATADRPKFRYFCPIWYSQTNNGLPWWMTFNRDTYSHDLLQILGGQNVFADRERRYPLDADLDLASEDEPSGQDKRYPRVGLDEVQSADPELILLPDEPYQFDETYLPIIQDLLADTPAVRNGSVSLVEGSLITWQGTRLALSLRELPALLDTCLGA